MIDDPQDKRTENDIPSKQIQEASQRSHFNIWQKRFQTKANKIKEIETVATYSSKENLLRGYCNFQHLCTKHKDPQFIKETVLHLKSYSDSHTVIVDGVINTPLSPTERSSRLTPNREMM